MKQKEYIEEEFRPPFPAKGQSLAAPKAEPVIYVVVYVATVLAALSILGYSIYKFDQKQEKERIMRTYDDHKASIEVRP